MKFKGMDWPTFRQVLGALLGIPGAVLVARGGVAMTPEAVAELASTKWDFNEAAVQLLAGQAADAKVGAFLVLIGVVLQLSCVGSIPRECSAQGKRLAWMLAVVATGLVAWLALHASAGAARDLYERARTIASARAP